MLFAATSQSYHSKQSLNLSSVGYLLSTVAHQGTNHCIQVTASRSSLGFAAHYTSRNAWGYLWFTSYGSCHPPHHSHVFLPLPAHSVKLIIIEMIKVKTDLFQSPEADFFLSWSFQTGSLNRGLTVQSISGGTQEWEKKMQEYLNGIS